MPYDPTARPRRADSPHLMALAFSDAVRDILRADGVFHLGDSRRGDAVWAWDGVRWTRVPLGAARRRPEGTRPPDATAEADVASVP